MGALLDSESQRKAVTSFCEEVMAHKEEKEREPERDEEKQLLDAAGETRLIQDRSSAAV